MIDKDRLGAMTDPLAIQEEIKSRINLINQMVGTLYPSILFDEIIQLRERHYELTGKSSPL